MNDLLKYNFKIPNNTRFSEGILMKMNWIDDDTVVSDDPRRIPIEPKPKGPEGTKILSGGRIFDGTGRKVFEGTIVIERNKIKAILPPDSTDWEEDAQIIDVHGKTILPGLIDLHTHLTYTEETVPPTLALNEADQTLRALERMRYYLESGITSVRDLGSQGLVPFRLKEWIAQNRIPGPRIFTAGQFITSTGGHGAEGLDEHHPLYGGTWEVFGPDQWRNAVREQFKRGADLIKTGSHFSPAEIKAAVEEAHALGLKITCDAERFYIQWAVEAGVDIIEHPLPRTDETILLMAEKGVAAVPTIIPYDIIFKKWGGYWGSTSRRFTFSRESILILVRKMKDAGIKLGVGTDLVFEWFRWLPDAYLAELKNFLEIGYLIPEILQAATKHNAEILDMADKLGTLEPNKLADILVIDGKPDLNLDDMKNVNLVIRDGFIVVKKGQVIVERHPDQPIPDFTEEDNSSKL